MTAYYIAVYATGLPDRVLCKNHAGVTYIGTGQANLYSASMGIKILKQWVARASRDLKFELRIAK